MSQSGGTGEEPRGSDYYVKTRELYPERARFIKTTLCTLEKIVLDPYKPAPERVAAGRLRLCVQASIRYIVKWFEGYTARLPGVGSTSRRSRDSRSPSQNLEGKERRQHRPE